MAINYGTFDLIDNGCLGASADGGGSGGRNSPIAISQGGDPVVSPNVLPDCGKGFYFEIFQWVIDCQASDGDISRIRVPWLEIAFGSPATPATYLFNLNLHAFVNDSSGDGDFPLFQLIPVQGGRFNGVKLGGNSDAFQWKINSDVDQDFVDIDFNYCGGANEPLERVLLADGSTSSEAGKFQNMDISLWTFRATLLYWSEGA